MQLGPAFGPGKALRALFGAAVRGVGDYPGDCGNGLGTVWEERGRLRRYSSTVSGTAPGIVQG